MILILQGKIPTKKNRYRVGNHGRLFKPKDITDFERMVGQEIAAQRLGLVRGRFRVDIDLIVSGSHEQDLDGAVTTLLDCLQLHEVIQNDRECVEIAARKVYSEDNKNGARIHIESV